MSVISKMEMVWSFSIKITHALLNTTIISPVATADPRLITKATMDECNYQHQHNNAHKL